MATKAQLIMFIMDKFEECEGQPVSKAKLDGLKKADLEEFIVTKGLEDELKEWLANKAE